MLVVCNGNTKSGSTWMTRLVAEAGHWAKLPVDWQATGWKNPSLDEAKLPRFAAEQPWRQQDLYCKQHWAGRAEYLALAHSPGVRTLLCVRDLKDVLVSRYFHDLRVAETKAPSLEYYYFGGEGRVRMREYLAYHRFWREAACPQALLLTYEDMLSDFDTQAHRLFAFLERPLTSQGLEKIKARTSFAFLNKKNAAFFRKGQVGDWVNHFTPVVMQDLHELATAEDFDYRMQPDLWPLDFEVFAA
ncbi:sulfotransferase domain-containing protein [Ideonella livida]|uniref:Sulfotransferase domain-containing protein n=1 Tax=Ideonella livida TaxID=2707176 RepID=A0A7C9TMD1_9BURK|nr:sulfotransferase domain-containing protein [Ideonella livida]NDY93941.1 sulfotransferase domain-containing protein [Ideonella livida]